MAAPSMKTIGTYTLVLVGVATLVVLSSLALRPVRVSGTARAKTPDGASTSDAFPSDTSNSTAGPGASMSSTCTTVPAASVSPASLRQAQLRGRELLAQQNYDEALVRFRSIAAMDAALPGINLDLSSAFLKLHQNAAAQRAINAQISTSECLLRLAPAALDDYCKVQLPKTSTSECRQELASITRSAHFQSALVQMELGNNLGGTGTQAAPSTVADILPPPKARTPAKAPHTALAVDGVPARAKPPAAGKRSSNPLAGGTGTDADLGAYSKQP